MSFKRLCLALRFPFSFKSFTNTHFLDILSQIFTDIHDGFAGVSSGVLEAISDDYAKKCRLCFALMPATFEDDTRHTMDRAMLNVLFSFDKYTGDGCQVIPMSLRDSYGLRHKLVEFPHIEYKVSVGPSMDAILL